MEKKVSFGLPFKMPNNLNWLFYRPIFLPQVVNGTINTRNTLFHNTRALTLVFMEKTKIKK